MMYSPSNFPGAYRGAAHNSCNFQYSIHPKRWHLPVLFHNLKNYDSKFIVNAAREDHGPIRVIPTNMEKFMAFSIGRLQFLDSFQFTQQSLDKLAKTMKEEDFVYTRRHFTDRTQFELMTKKGELPPSPVYRNQCTQKNRIPYP